MPDRDGLGLAVEIGVLFAIGWAVTMLPSCRGNARPRDGTTAVLLVDHRAT